MRLNVLGSLNCCGKDSVVIGISSILGIGDRYNILIAYRIVVANTCESIQIIILC